MNSHALTWTPEISSSYVQAGDAIATYMDHEVRFALFENGTALLMKPHLDRKEMIVGAMTELRTKTDFKVNAMKDGNFLVWLASAVCVFISSEDATRSIEALKKDASGALFPGESFVGAEGQGEHYLIGLAGRAKAHRDAHEQNIVFRYVPNHKS